MRSRHPFPDVVESEPPATIPLPTTDAGVKAEADWVPAEPPQERFQGVSKPHVVPDIRARFVPHQGENRVTRRKAVATWTPPENTQEGAGTGTGPPPAMPTRRELLKQRQRRNRGTLDVATRRLQRKALTK